MSKSQTSTPLKYLVYVFLVIFLGLTCIFILFFSVQNRHTFQAPQNSPSLSLALSSAYSPPIAETKNCPTSESLVALLTAQKNLFPNLKVEQYNLQYGGTLFWQTKKFPFTIGYPVQTGAQATFTTSPQKVMVIPRFFQTSFEPLILDKGFSFYASFTPNSNQVTDSVYRAYTKNDALMTVEFYSVSDPNIMNVSILCSARNSNFEAIYNELSRSKDLLSSLQKNQTKTVAIDTFHKNNIISLGIGDTKGWFIKTNDLWSEFYEGQDYPLCDVLEKHGIEPGVQCLNPNNPNQSLTQ